MHVHCVNSTFCDWLTQYVMDTFHQRQYSVPLRADVRREPLDRFPFLLGSLRHGPLSFGSEVPSTYPWWDNRSVYWTIAPLISAGQQKYAESDPLTESSPPFWGINMSRLTWSKDQVKRTGFETSQALQSTPIWIIQIYPWEERAKWE
jgi:hypothetical protein